MVKFLLMHSADVNILTKVRDTVKHAAFELNAGFRIFNLVFYFIVNLIYNF